MAVKEWTLLVSVILSCSVEFGGTECATRRLNAFQRVTISLHNRIRRLYDDLPDLCYAESGDDYTFSSRSWAKICAKRNTMSPSSLKLDNVIGENLGMQETIHETSRLDTLVTSIKAWYNNCDNLDLVNIAPEDVSTDSVRSCIQLLWRATREVNCALAKNETTDSGFVVCQYYPPISTGTSDFQNNLTSLRERSFRPLRKMMVMGAQDFATIFLTTHPTTNPSTTDTIITDEFTDNRHFMIEDKDGNQIKVVFPKIHTTFQDFSNGTIVAYLDHDEEFVGVESFQIILSTDETSNNLVDHGNEDGIMTYRHTLYTYSESLADDLTDLPYIAAELPSLPDVFILGDEATYGGYYNGRLRHGDYFLRVRGIIKSSDGEDIIIDTQVLAEFKSKWFTLFSFGGSSIVLVMVGGCVVSHFLRKRRERLRVKEAIDKFNVLLRDHHPTSTEEDESEVGANHVISPVMPEIFAEPSASGSEWWTMSSSSVGTRGPGSRRPGFSQQQLSDSNLNAEFTAVEAATKLLTGKNITRRRTAHSDHDMLLSNVQIRLPDSNMREDEIYHLH